MFKLFSNSIPSYLESDLNNFIKNTNYKIINILSHYHTVCHIFLYSWIKHLFYKNEYSWKHAILHGHVHWLNYLIIERSPITLFLLT